MAAVACTRRCGQSCYLERNFACDYRYQIRGQWKLTQAAPQPNWTRASRAAMSNRQDRARGPPRRASPGAFSDYAAGRPGGPVSMAVTLKLASIFTVTWVPSLLTMCAS